VRIINQKDNTMEKYFKDLEEWEMSFECNNCGELEQENFTYDRTVSNGEVWICKNCKTEHLVSEKPNEDDY